jgi:hypothetical protein
MGRFILSLVSGSLVYAMFPVLDTVWYSLVYCRDGICLDVLRASPVPASILASITAASISRSDYVRGLTLGGATVVGGLGSSYLLLNLLNVVAPGHNWLLPLEVYVASLHFTLPLAMASGAMTTFFKRQFGAYLHKSI